MLELQEAFNKAMKNKNEKIKRERLEKAGFSNIEINQIIYGSRINK